MVEKLYGCGISIGKCQNLHRKEEEGEERAGC
jgi:hypothetical protein